MRTLLSCYGFSPYRGSEAAVGWNVANELSRYCDVTVICGDLDAKQQVLCDLKRWESEGGKNPKLHFEYVHPTGFIRFVEKLHRIPGCWALYYLAYRLWQRNAYRRALSLHKAHPFDLVHHLTMIGYREPGYMWRLPIPFFWGPVGGGPDEPIGFWRAYSPSARVKVVLRNLINGLQKRISFRPRLAAKKAAKIWAVTDADVRMINGIWHCDCEKMLETAATTNEKSHARELKADESLRIVWSGTHTYGKGLPILVYALKRLKHELGGQLKISVDVLGRGPETAQWKRLCGDAGVAQYFNWLGYLPHDEALGVMNRAHLLAFTSVKEGTPHVVLESLAMGLPVVCHDACGMGVAVDDRCGVKIEMSSFENSVNGFTDVLRKVLLRELDIGALSRGALERAKELSWSDKTERIYREYEKVVNG